MEFLGVVVLAALWSDYWGRCWWGVAQYVSEGGCVVGAGDLVWVCDVDLGEERLVEVASLLVGGLQVGESAVRAELDGEFDDAFGVGFLGSGGGDGGLGLGELGGESGLFAFEQIKRDAAGVVGLQEREALVVEVGQSVGGSFGFASEIGLLGAELLEQTRTHARCSFGGQVNLHVVAKDSVFDGGDGEVGLGAAGAALASGAEEVRITAAGFAAGEGVDEPGAAAPAVQRAFEVVVVLAVAFAGEGVRFERLGDAVKQRIGDERCVDAPSFDVFESDVAQVVAVGEDAVERGGADRLGGALAGGALRQAAGGQFVAELVDADLACGVAFKGPADQRRAIGIEGDAAHLLSAGALNGVEVAKRGEPDGAAAFELLAESFLGFECEVAREELGVGSHDGVQELAGGRGVDALGNADQGGPGLLEPQVDGDVIETVAREAVDLVDDHVVDVTLGIEPREHGLQLRAVRGAGGLAVVDVLVDDLDFHELSFALAGLALGRDGVALGIAVAFGLFGGRDAEVENGVLHAAAPSGSVRPSSSRRMRSAWALTWKRRLRARSSWRPSS